MNILSSFTYPHVVPNQYDLHTSLQSKRFSRMFMMIFCRKTKKSYKFDLGTSRFIDKKHQTKCNVPVSVNNVAHFEWSHDFDVFI